MKVDLSDEATAQTEKIDTWWPENRSAAPDLFATELDHGVRLSRRASVG